MMRTLDSLLRKSSDFHRHLYPRQVLGVRIGLAGMKNLGFIEPPEEKQLLIISETDGCFVDGLIASTGCHVGGRTLRIQDFGKVAATFVNTKTEEAFRIIPQTEIRSQAIKYASHAKNKWESMLLGYQHMPDEELFKILQVKLSISLTEILSHTGKKTICEVCEEEIINGREVIHEAMVLCQACVGNSYYQALEMRHS